MTASSQFSPDQFLVFDPEDRLHSSLCFGEAETREVIDQFGSVAGLKVWRVTPDEMSRDVTDDFIECPDDIAERLRDERIDARMWARHTASYSRPA
ncbi:hypothetical protein [Mesorhizobium sp. BE184]|uniref:hypothetical protein n=1 Tax=Mesorhizobium sp. BE184 TaxID=2817714 RepID=UPI002863171F|nr:hypothetical protein [Mesorhizobium sp. BE184]MDR7032398.1 hypothetical protein [Mesorhizobium sp. BE184]